MNKIYVTFLLVMLSVVSWAQPLFVPDMEIMKMGDVQFQTPKTVTFGFTNKGNQPLVLTSVKPSCGCTTVDYPKEAIPAGERGQITATYDAAMLGTFYKELAVYTNASDDPIYLTMQGSVVTEVHDFSGEYPIDLGNVRLLSNYIEFDDVNKGDHPIAEIRLVNAEHTAYKPELMHLPPYLTAEAIPENIPAGHPGVIKLTLDSEKLNTLGLTQTSVYLSRYQGDKVSDTNEIIISSVLLPDFSNLSASQLENAPEIALSTNDLDLGSMGNKKKISAVVYISNIGKSKLNIQQVQVFNRALTVSLSNRTLAPGKTTKLKIQVLAKYLKNAKARPRVLLISDDPNHSKQIINVSVTD